MTVIAFPDTRRAKVASQHLREAVILWLSVIHASGRDAFELAAEDLFDRHRCRARPRTRQAGVSRLFV